MLRGLAVVWMAVFHFCFDLNHAGFIQQDFYRDPWWTGQRTAIVTLFLLCVGMGQAVSMAQGQSWARFWRRWLQVLACAVAVSLGSWWMFPGSFISFGVLHGIAFMLIVLRLSGSAGGWLWPAGAVMLVAPMLIQHAFFDSRWTNWVGLVTRKPVTEDFVPVLPWLGVALWGLALGQWLLRRRPQALADPLPAALRRIGSPLAWLGRHSLAFYMVHQPVLIGLVSAMAWWRAAPA